MKPFIKMLYVQDRGFLEDIKSMASPFHVRCEIRIAFDELTGVTEYTIDVCDKAGLKLEIDNIFLSDFEIKNNTTSHFMDKTLVVARFDSEQIAKLLSDFVDSCAGKDWNEINLKLQKKLDFYP